MNHITLGRTRRDSALQWLHQFPVLSRDHLLTLVFPEHLYSDVPRETFVRRLNNTLLSLAREKRVKRFRVANQFCYSLKPGPNDKTEHGLRIGDVFCTLFKAAPDSVFGSAEVTVGQGMRVDLLVTYKHRAVIVEVEMGTKSVEAKLKQYTQFDPAQFTADYPKGYWPSQWNLWIVTTEKIARRLAPLEREYRALGIPATVSNFQQATELGWGELARGLTPPRTPSTDPP